MCIGMPMMVVDCDEQFATCLDNGLSQRIDVRLVGQQPPGTWLLVFLGAAREVMTEKDAQHTLDAVKAMQKIMSGDHNIEALFADLIDREPALPEHLQTRVK